MKVLVLPKDRTPYQELLYRPLRSQGVVVDYMPNLTSSHTVNMLLLPFQLIVKRMQGYQVLHVHWLYFFVLPWGGAFGRRLMQTMCVVCIWLAKLVGFKLVWTVHNILPHKQIFANDVRMRRFMGKRANEIIVHSTATIEKLVTMGVGTTAKMTVIPHGNYENVYPKVATRPQARKTYDIPADAFVLLFFGNVDAYKNIPAILELVRRATKKHPDVHFLIAGSCKDAALRSQIEHAAEAFSTLHIQLRYIPDEEVQQCFVAADASILPFAEITTSGSTILSLTYGVPVIVPRTGALTDMPLTVGFFYDPRKKHGLRDAFEGCLSRQSLAPERRAARAYAQTLSWEYAARRTEEVYRRA